MKYQYIDKNYIKKIIKNALEEDCVQQDITSSYLIPINLNGNFQLIAKENGILCGTEIFKETFYQMSKKIIVEFKKVDGDKINKNEQIAQIKGPVSKILSGERVALNFLQMLSGVSTITNEFVKRLGKEKNIQIRDTRKTIPTMRALQKYAVLQGKGHNHRDSLKEFILIKDNHLNSSEKNINEIINNYRKKLKNKYLIELEVENLLQAQKALKNDIDVLLLDNMSIQEIKKVCNINRPSNIKIEISGGINLQNINQYKNLPIDYIAIGAITHSAKYLDMSIEIE
ncbi:MAG: carboxylating nicotinate-nucleotide diphosphorylase [Dehalococcoidia bacterium]|jgi:nicotinate-nucleotide pyrophosphorylase (carboxylating)|nr:MAG: nicotinate-nucleotide pyrophosphorylase (carboxylating) [Chloroflexota bacterium]|tara:strand:+ start:3302 stop:4156 length:855 start_codon:yes stop_codon:yes gene_type:complete